MKDLGTIDRREIKKKRDIVDGLDELIKSLPTALSSSSPDSPEPRVATMWLDISFLEKVLLLETPKGFALFNIHDDILNAPMTMWSWFAREETAENVIFYLDYIKVDDKSAVWGSNGPGEMLSSLIWKYCRNEKELIVGDEKLRGVIKSNMKEVKLFDDDYLAKELVWGVKNVLSDFLYQEKDNITPEYLLPLSEGLKNSIRFFGINVPTEGINQTFIRFAGSLHRSFVLLYHLGKDLREACDKLVPGIGEMIEDDTLYAEVMAKILTPKLSLVKDWEFSGSFPPDMVLKLQKADAAADDARKQIDYTMKRLIHCSLSDLRRLPGVKSELLEKLKTYAEEYSRWQESQVTGKRCRVEGVEAAETSCREEDSSDASSEEDSPDASSEVYKKARKIVKDEPKWLVVLDELENSNKRKSDDEGGVEEKMKKPDDTCEKEHPIGTKEVKKQRMGKGKNKTNDTGLDEEMKTYVNIQAAATKRHEDFIKTQQRVCDAKVEAARLIKEASLLDSYKTLMSMDTSGMDEEMKVEHKLGLKMLREKLVGHTN